MKKRKALAGSLATSKTRSRKNKIEIVEQVPNKPYSVLKMNWLNDFANFKKVGSFVKDKLNPERTLLIRMELNTGMHDEFMISLKQDFFMYLGGKYYIDKDKHYYVASAKTWASDYHQSFSLPIKREMPVDKIKETVESLDPTFIIHSTNPQLLEQFAESNVMEKMMKAQDMDDFFKQLRLMLLIILIACIVHLVLWLNESGALGNIL